MYKIKVSYKTGDSFSSENVSDYLDLTWENLEIAKENLQRIKEHYEYYKYLQQSSCYKNALSRKWENKKIPDFIIKDEYANVILLKLKANNGNEMQLNPFWTGYFETLYEVEIVIDNEDTKITF